MDTTFLHAKHTPPLHHTTSHKKLPKNFLICGLTGWCMEILFTSAGSLMRHDKRMIGQTSVWMFPIYGMAAVISPLSRRLKGKSALFRGSIYTMGIFSFEYLTGTLLKKHHLCPWDYSGAKTNINGVIRLDYAPFWMAAGLLFERILTRSEEV
jgi:uncharacterized membrane protein